MSGISSFLCDPSSFWLPDRCAFLIFIFFTLATLILLNVVSIICNAIIYPISSQILRSGYLQPIYYLVLTAHFLLALPLPALFILHFNASFQILIGIFLHALFWIFTAFRLWTNRKQHDLPITLIISYGMICLLLTIPLFSWHEIFPDGVNDSYFVFYLIEAFISFVIFVSIISNFLLKRKTESTWIKYANRVVEIWPYIWPKKSIRLQLIVLACLLLLGIGRGINILIPLYNKWIVDALSGPNPYFCWQMVLISASLKYLQGSGAQGGLLNTLRSFLWLPVQQYTTLEIEVNLLRHLHSLSLRWHISRRTGEILRVVNRGVDSMNTLMNYILFNVLPALLDILFASIFFFTTFNIYFGLLVVFTMAAYMAATIFISEWRIHHRREMNECEKRAGTIGVDSLINYETVKHYNAEELETQKYKEAYLTYQKAEFITNTSLSALNFTQNSIIGFGLLSGSLLATYMISNQSAGGKMMSAGDYVLFTTYLLQLYTPLNFFGTIYRVIQRSFIDMENMQELFSEEIEIKNAPDAKELEHFSGAIQFIDVSFSYKSDMPILHNINFTVNPGETVALVGPSGSGKTTIIRLLFSLYDVTSGQILFNDTDIRQLKLKSLRDRIGIVPQDTVLFNETIRYNIRYGRPSATDEDVEEAAKAAAIHQFILSHPDGYDCLVGERGLKLSGGEKQRVAISRALLKRPEYILLDEATSALDSQTERSIQQNLYELCQRRTCLIVAHRLSTVIHADKILVLNEGQIAESGTHEQLLSQKGLYSQMWRLQNERSTFSSENQQT